MTLIVCSFPTIVHQDQRFTFEHLVPFSVQLAGHRMVDGDLNVRVSFKTHVFTRRHEGEKGEFSLHDESGVPRQFVQIVSEIRLPYPMRADI